MTTHCNNLEHVEEWRPVHLDEYANLYEVSNLGRVRSVKRSVKAKNRTINYSTRILRQNIDTGGYAQVTLCNQARRKTVGVHQLVAHAFLGTPPVKLDVCHNDGKHTHNHPENLRWGTRSENVMDNVKFGTHNWAKGHIPRDKKAHREECKEQLATFTQGQCHCHAGKSVEILEAA